MHDMQSVDEWDYALLQGVQCMVLRVMVSEVVPQAPQCISEELNLLCLLTEHEHKKTFLSTAVCFFKVFVYVKYVLSHVIYLTYYSWKLEWGF